MQVSQLIYRTYGGTYFNEDVYYPDRIAALNSKNRVLSMVAAGEDGRLAQRALGVLAGAEDVLGALEGDDAMAILGGLQH